MPGTLLCLVGEPDLVNRVADYTIVEVQRAGGRSDWTQELSQFQRQRRPLNMEVYVNSYLPSTTSLN